MDKYTATPDFNTNIRPSITDKARTVTHVCNSGTLCTVVTNLGSENTAESFNAPFGSYVDYILDKVLIIVEYILVHQLLISL